MTAIPSLNRSLGRSAIWALAAFLFTLILIVTLARPITASASSLDSSSIGSTDEVTVFIADRENNRVVSVPGEGGPVTELVTGLFAPAGLAVSGDVLYIVDSGNGRVVSVPISGGPITELVNGLSYPSGIAVADGTMYIAEIHNDRVLSAPSVGGVTTEVTSGIGGPWGLAVADETLFITVPANDSVLSIPTSGGTTTELTGGIDSPNYVAVSGDSMFVTNYSANVVSMRASGGPVTELDFFASLSDPAGIAVAGDRIFFADQLNDRVVSSSVSGGAVTELVTGLDTPTGVAVSGVTPCQGSSCTPVVGSLFSSLD